LLCIAPRAHGFRRGLCCDDWRSNVTIADDVRHRLTDGTR
jgi:hypothetical protein